MKHTPGPWSANKWAPGYSVSAPNSQYTVCNLSGCNNEEANAHLIARAPAMLAALRAIVARIDGEFDNPVLVACGPLTTDTEADVAEIARAVLQEYNQAKGGE